MSHSPPATLATPHEQPDQKAEEQAPRPAPTDMDAKIKPRTMPNPQNVIAVILGLFTILTTFSVLASLIGVEYNQSVYRS